MLIMPVLQGKDDCKHSVKDEGSPSGDNDHFLKRTHYKHIPHSAGKGLSMQEIQPYLQLGAYSFLRHNKHTKSKFICL